MLSQATVRVGLWISSAFLAAGTVGMGWALNPVEIPLLWLLVLTFVPTSDLIDAFRQNLNRIKPPEKGDPT